MLPHQGRSTGDWGEPIVQLRVQEQAEDARIDRDERGQLLLCLRTGLISDRAYVAIGLALADLIEQGAEYLHHAG